MHHRLVKCSGTRCPERASVRWEVPLEPLPLLAALPLGWEVDAVVSYRRVDTSGATETAYALRPWCSGCVARVSRSSVWFGD